MIALEIAGCQWSPDGNRARAWCGHQPRSACNQAAIFLAAVFAAASPGALSAAMERPPQFVLFSFDNCTEIERWRELSEFQEEMDKRSVRVRFTFFVSGANLLANRNSRA